MNNSFDKILEKKRKARLRRLKKEADLHPKATVSESPWWERIKLQHINTEWVEAKPMIGKTQISEYMKERLYGL